jgi:protein-S-isoprenylcysteine O-methyltransferase Ste14
MFVSIKYKDYLFVGIQLLLFITYIIAPNYIKLNLHTFHSIAGLAITIIGFVIILVAILQLNVNLSPFPTPTKNGSLLKTGVYKYVRHPIYSGILMAAAGFSFYSNDGCRILITLALLLLFYFKSNYEEKLLKKQFSDYAVYMLKTGKFFPTFKQLFHLNK